MSFQKFPLVLSALFAISLSGCASNDFATIAQDMGTAVANVGTNLSTALEADVSGTEITDGDIESISVGMDQEEIRGRFGFPSEVATVNGKDIWRYRYEATRGVTELDQLTTIRFDRDGKVVRAFREHDVLKGKTEYVNTMNVQMHGERITPFQMAQLDPGMSYSQVESVLGLPSEVKAIGAGQSWFYYFLEMPLWGQNKHEITVIRFDESGELVSAAVEEGRTGSNYLAKKIPAMNSQGY